MPADAVIAVDVGNNTYSFGRYFECQRSIGPDVGLPGLDRLRLPRRHGRLGRRAHERKTICVTGDGGFGQYMGEFTTAVKYGMDITHVLLNNDELGKISKEQRAGEWDVWQTSLHNPNFADYATSCGGLGIRVERREDLDAAIQRGLDHAGPALDRGHRGRRADLAGIGKPNEVPHPFLRPIRVRRLFRFARDSFPSLEARGPARWPAEFVLSSAS